MSKYEGTFLERTEQSASSPDQLTNASYLNSLNKIHFRDSGHPIPFSKELAYFIEKQVRKAFALDKPYLYDPKTLGNPEVDGEIKRFICALCAYFDPRSEPKLSKNELFEGIRDQHFVSKLKKLRFKSFVTSMEEGTITDPDVEWEQQRSIYITDIGQVFNYKYWLFWSEEDPHDEKWSLEPLNKITEDQINEFKEALKDCLPEHVDVVYEEEILLQSTSSSCLSTTSNLSSKVYIDKQNSKINSFSNESLKTKLVYVQKCPGDTRRASVLTVPQSNTIKLIEKQVAIIAQDTLDSIYVVNDEEFARRYRTFKLENEFFLCRDIRKDGLTKIRPFVKATLDVLSELYPDLPMHKYNCIYNDWTWWLAESPEKKVQPPRGVGLGMTSAITTLMQAAHKKTIINRMLREDIPLLHKISALFYHDDAAIGFKCQSDLDEYDSYEDVYFEEIGFIKNKKKTFSAKDFVVCETYSNSLNDKKSYQLNLLYAPFAATNIVHAKMLLQQLVKFETQFDVNCFIKEYISYWGYEFVPEESTLPFRLGGWVPAEYRGVDTTFNFYEESNSLLHQSLMTASSCQSIDAIVHKDLRKDEKIYFSPVEQLFGSSLECKGYESTLNYRQPMKLIHKKFGNFMRPGLICEAYNRLYLKRQRLFEKNKQSKILTTLKVYTNYLNWYPFKDILPPKDLFEERDIESFKSEFGLYYHDIGHQPNATMSFLAFHNPENMKLNNVIPSPLPPSVTGPASTRGETNEERKLASKGIKLLTGTYMLQGKKYIEIGPYYNFLETNWIDPYSVAAAYQACHILPKIPVVPLKINDLWKDIVEFRTSHFHLWWKDTKHKNFFKHLVKHLGWKKVNNEIVQSEQFFELLIEELELDIQKEKPLLTYLEVELPPETLDEYRFFYKDVMNNGASFVNNTNDYVLRDWDSESRHSVGTMNTNEAKEFWDNFVEDPTAYKSKSESDFSGLFNSNNSEGKTKSYNSDRDGSLIPLEYNPIIISDESDSDSGLLDPG